jgi:hypothetical protein
MTCGIYKLKFNNTNKLYIGQSINIEDRYLSHIRNMRSNNSSNKLLEAYNIYGIPQYEIILECAEDELDIYENEAIQIFDSYNNGFNTLETAEEMPKWKNKLKGEEGPTAIYTNDQILQAINLMCDPLFTLVKISELTNIKYTTIRKISQGTQHLWVLEQYPELWNRMLATRTERKANNVKNRSELLKYKFCAKSQGIVYPLVIFTDGTVHNIENFSEFCRINNLQAANLRKVINGKRISHKGWKLYNQSV